jgi:hypothetical protein
MNARRAPLLTALAIGVAALLAGCVSPPVEIERPEPIVIGCAAEAPPSDVFVGEAVEVTRGPDGLCDGLAVGRTQTFTFRSTDRTSTVGSSIFAEIGENGSFSFELEVPADMRLGRAVLEAVPRVTACDDDNALECPPPSAHVIVRHRPTALRPVALVSSRLPTPALPSGGGVHAYVLRMPLHDELTVVLAGKRCETIPTAFVATAPRGSLELVSGPRPSGSCLQNGRFWTSVIEVPKSHAAFTSVKIDNIPVSVLPATG